MFGYQGGLSDDGDPNTESLLLGETVKKTPISANGYSVVYLETIRDRQFTKQSPIAFTLQGDRDRLRGEYLRTIYNVLAHELGHAPGDRFEFQDHAESDLMAPGPLDDPQIYGLDNIPKLRFAPATIKRFRSATKWVE